MFDLYCGRGGDKKLALYVIAYTPEGVFKARIGHEHPADLMVVEQNNQRALIDPFALTIKKFREDIQTEPGFAVVSPEVGQALADWVPGLLGDLSTLFDSFRRMGKTHICVVPHGPLHFFPFHLLGPIGEPLGSTWTITYLPSVALLTRQRSPRRRGCSAIGKSFSSYEHGLSPIPGSIEEVTSIANTFGNAPFVEADATKDRVIHAVSNDGFVHISTHGEHNAIAPAFSCLHLTGPLNTETNDRLFSYEIESCDLRGLDIVTLSSCDSMLGRLDIGGNLRGLPASFLIGGAATLIGTLWPASATSCKTFFTAFYHELLAQRATKLEAFKRAQDTTRSSFPAYRDWGAFYFSGDWT
jgi:CHAT domain-containing protein